MTIGVAIPCYSGHVRYITPLLDNIAESTRKPDDIVISCSSSENNRTLAFVYKDMSVRIWYSTERLNQATNRNRAASLLKTDLITFIDADDLMHPKRIEYLCKAFESRPDIDVVYHNYLYNHVSKRNDPFWDEPEFNPLPNPMVKNPAAVGLMVLTNPPGQYEHHHAHVTLRKAVFDRLKFDEEWRFYRMEDSIYGVKLLNNNIPMLFLNNRLTRYIFN
jgi:glycosyltransferase involved in cell wall biosynthesis